MRRVMIIAMLTATAGAWAQEPAAAPGQPPAPAPLPAAPAAPTPAAPEVSTAAAPPAAAPTSLEALAGLGLYEALHVGLSLRTSPRNAFSLFVGSNLSLPEADVALLGAAWHHALGGPWKGLDKGLLLRAVYWTSEDAFYRWTLLSAEAGLYLRSELRPGTTVTLDAAAVYTATLESDRLQDQTFGNPTRWNANVCLSITQRFAAW